MKKLPFDKYELYLRSVQSPKDDVMFFRKAFRHHIGHEPKLLRENFCGTASVCVEWVKLGLEYQAIGVDLDPEPLDYSQKKYIAELNANQQSRLSLLQKNVLDLDLPQADIIVSLNFSYFLFKKRNVMLNFLTRTLEGLNPGGLAFFDLFGGSQCGDAIEDRTRIAREKDKTGFIYYWDQKGFDPVTNEAEFKIHFEVNGKKYKDLFSYDWRMWSIPEMRELLEEAGFSKTHVYWEGTSKDGTGNGVFKPVDKGEACLSWIAYIVAEK